jgi:hypothetical protein
MLGGEDQSFSLEDVSVKSGVKLGFGMGIGQILLAIVIGLIIVILGYLFGTLLLRNKTRPTPQISQAYLDMLRQAALVRQNGQQPTNLDMLRQAALARQNGQQVNGN